ncbi:hypothetical protein BT63DRAFT_418747 [Microthyrium microscopicum]|uniref:Uncharacterized protein n=1 Tax=Microthyrium microscopicum TaxID=703497 RepID=A0A6A6TXY8_9PEZI|nr:hypothetical protein BT63DRAFT_418747 [Microthyrium microscopicum]
MLLTKRWRPLQSPNSPTCSHLLLQSRNKSNLPPKSYSQVPILNEWSAVWQAGKTSGLGDGVTPLEINQFDRVGTPSPLDRLPKYREHVQRPRWTEQTPEYKKQWTDKFPLLAGKVLPKNVLILRGLNKNLIEADFLRITLWKGQISPIVRVFPLRKPGTMEKLDQYMVIFRHEDHLNAWRRRLEHLCKMSRRYTISSLLHPVIAPQEGFKLHGVEIDQVVKAFALAPAGVIVRTNNYPTLAPGENHIVQQGGYTELVDRTGARKPSVVVRIVGAPSVKLTDLLQAIMYDGNLRNMPWDVVLDTEGRQTASFAIDDESENMSKEQSVERVKLAKDEKLPAAAGVQDDSVMASTDMDELYKLHEGVRFVVYFHSEHIAQQFARAWHCRPLPLPPKPDKRYKFSQPLYELIDGGKSLQTKVYAEVLW